MCSVLEKWPWKFHVMLQTLPRLMCSGSHDCPVIPILSEKGVSSSICSSDYSNVHFVQVLLPWTYHTYVLLEAYRQAYSIAWHTTNGTYSDHGAPVCWRSLLPLFSSSHHQQHLVTEQQRKFFFLLGWEYYWVWYSVCVCGPCLLVVFIKFMNIFLVKSHTVFHICVSWHPKTGPYVC
jgi:hypothetical protein